jgi:hypothetical protein
MTILFIKPLMRMSGNTIAFGSKMNSRLHEVALRTLVASVVCLVVSFANIFALVMLNGRERGLVCMTCCTVDVTVNVITVHWVTTQAPGKRSKETEMDHTNMSDSGHDVTKHQHEKVLGFKDIDLNIPHYSTSKVVVEDQRSSSESALVPSYQDSHTSRKTLTKQ